MDEYQSLTGKYVIDPAHSRIGFVARYAMITRVRGSFHAFSGEIVADGEHPENSSVTVTIDAASIDTGHPDRDVHLRSADFFDVDTFGTITFRSHEIEIEEAGHLHVHGDLTIRGVSRQVALEANYGGASRDPAGNERIGFEASTAVDRNDFGLAYNVPLATGGFLISDRLAIELDISAIRQ